MEKCCIVLLTICCILLTTACKDKSTVNTDTKNTSSVSSEVEGNESISSQESSDSEIENVDTPSKEITEQNATTESKPAIESKPTTEGKPTHQHNYVCTVTKEATCASSGTKKYHCSCGHYYTETIAITSHNYSSATCTSAKKCTVCGATLGDALGHNYSNGYCTRCNSSDPKPKKSLNIPSLPLTAKKLWMGRTDTIVKITDISYNFDGFGYLNIYISGEKTYDCQGNGGNNSIGATLKVYDSEGYVVDDSFLLVKELKVGEKFRNKEITLYHVPKDCTTLTLEITDYD